MIQEKTMGITEKDYKTRRKECWLGGGNSASLDRSRASLTWKFEVGCDVCHLSAIGGAADSARRVDTAPQLLMFE